MSNQAKDNQARLIKACKVAIRQGEGQGYIGSDAVMELHRALKNSTPDLKRPKLDAKEDDCIALYMAVAKYVGQHGGEVLIAGGVQIQEWPEDKEYTFHVAVKCTGRKPKKVEA